MTAALNKIYDRCAEGLKT